MLYKFLVDLALAVGYLTAETHTVSFNNKCGYGHPTLVAQNGKILSTGSPYTSHKPLIGAIAYLQAGHCGHNGERCTLLETTLKNPTCPGCSSSTDISLIPPHDFSVTVDFRYHGGCDGKGAKCDNPKCKTAFHKPSDTQVQVACDTKNVNLEITFC